MAERKLDAAPSEVDPYEDWNRKVYGFNETIDNWFLRPVAKGYRAIMPDFADRAVTNFFNNLSEIRNLANSLFQLKGESAVVAVGRFTYNTVFGLGGLIDVATMFDLPERPEDFGQTLGYWGFGLGALLDASVLGAVESPGLRRVCSPTTCCCPRPGTWLKRRMSITRGGSRLSTSVLT